MIDLKFRGKSLRTGRMVVGNSYLVRADLGTAYIDAVKVDPETIGEWSGKHDMDGTPIFTGDIVDFNGTLTVCRRFTTSYRLIRKNGRTMTWMYCEKYKVVGNIYENSELLKDWG